MTTLLLILILLAIVWPRFVRGLLIAIFAIFTFVCVLEAMRDATTTTQTTEVHR